PPCHGEAAPPVRALTLVDPTCPHCRSAHRTLSTFVDGIADRAVFYYHPHALWNHSIPQIQALMIAQDEGRFFEMLEAQFANQERFAALHRGQQSNPDLWLDGVIAGLAQIAGEIGMDAAALERDLRDRKYVGVIGQRATMLQQAGVRSVPRLVLEGDVMANTTQAWSRECITGLVDQHIAEAATDEAATDEAPATSDS